MAQPDTLQSLMQAFQEDEKLMDRLERAVFGSAESYQRSLNNALDDAIGSLITDDDGLIRGTVENSNIIEQIERDIDVILEENGLPEAKDEILDSYKQRLDTVDNLIDEAGIEGASGIDFESLPEIQQEINKFTDSLDDATPEVAQIVRNEMNQFRNTVDGGGAVSFSDFRQTLITKAGIMPRYAGTVGNTQLMSLDRTARIAQADKAGIKKMKYMGVLDGLTRPFCRDMVGEVKSIEDWRNMQNNVDPQPVSKYCGGWNCRHRLMLWRDEFEREQTQSSEQFPTRYDRRLDSRSSAPLTDKWREEMNILLSEGAEIDVKFTDFGTRGAFNEYDKLIKLPELKGAKISRHTAVHEYGHAVHSKTNILGAGAAGDGTAIQKAWTKEYLDIAKKVKDKILDKVIFSDKTPYAFADELNEKFKRDIADRVTHEVDPEKSFFGDINKFRYTDDPDNVLYDEVGTVSDLFDSQLKGELNIGHSKSYWTGRLKDMTEADDFAMAGFTDQGEGFLKELFAHAMENRYHTNTYMKEEFPEIHEIIENDFNELMDKIVTEMKSAKDAN